MLFFFFSFCFFFFFFFFFQAEDGIRDRTVTGVQTCALPISIKKDKLFFFSSYEGTLNHRTLQAFASVLTPAMRAGDFSGGLGDFDCFQSDGSIQTSSSPGCPSAAAGTTIAPVMVTTTEGTSVQAQDGMIFNPNTGDPASALGRQVYSCGGAINVIAPCNTLDPIAQIMLDPAQFVALPNRSGARRNLFVSGPFH